MINITETNHVVVDTNYRYRMPPIMTKREGKGAGKTVICNIADVAKHLQRSAEEIMHYFSFELGARGTFNKERNEGFINGPHSTHSLQTLLSKYIDEFVICVGCGLPETIYITDKRNLYQDCASCGMRSAHMRHRLADALHKKLHKSDKLSKSSRCSKQDKSPQAKPTASSKAIPTACRCTAAETLRKNDCSCADSSDEGEDSKISSSTGLFQTTTKQTSPNKYPIMRELVEILDSGIFSSNALNTEQLALAMNSYSSPNGKQRALVAALEWMCGWKYPQYMERFPVLLMQLYEKDLLDEDFLLDIWCAEDSTATCSAQFLSLASELLRSNAADSSSVEDISRIYSSLRASAEPFVTWLREADEQEEEESDDDDA
jgi:translation initiation factor 2 beta subunit (eIF-2beta)/eIF-5